MSRNLVNLCLAAVLLLAGCASPGEQAPQTEKSPPVITASSLDTNLPVLQSIRPHLDAIDGEFQALPTPRSQGRDYFTAAEVDLIEGMLFEFLAMQTTLWDIANRYGGIGAHFENNLSGAKAEVLASTATLLITSHTALIVSEFADKPEVIKQFNEPYYRAEIPFGTYDRMRETVTTPGLLDAVTEAKSILSQELADPSSALSQLAQTDPAYRELIDALPPLQAETEQRLQQVAVLFPSHAETEKMARKDADSQHKMRYAIRSWMFKEISRFKNPSAHVAVFTEEQRSEIFNLLQPGDLILTYTAGYMSDVFIPGAFKHGITYIGTPADRKGMGLSADLLPKAQLAREKQIEEDLVTAKRPDGRPANVIEAVAEGVIFNDLNYLMDTHINRMLVLRPRLDEKERATFLVEVFGWLGDRYDFRFDFADASMQVCTEVIYRALNGKGRIDFPLTVRAGHETLSADDVALYYLDTNPDAFEFVLLVETDSKDKSHAAELSTGSAGQEELRRLMTDVGSE